VNELLSETEAIHLSGDCRLSLPVHCALCVNTGIKYGLAVSVSATGPTGHSAAGSKPTEGGGFLWVIKISSTYYLLRGSKALDLRHVKEPYTA
jgi:hypothetical protein